MVLGQDLSLGFNRNVGLAILGLSGLEDPSLMVIDEQPQFLLAVGRKHQFLLTRSPPEGCLSVLTKCRLAFFRVSGPRKRMRRKPQWLCDPVTRSHTQPLPPQSVPQKHVTKYSSQLRGSNQILSKNLWIYVINTRECNSNL